MLMCSCVHHPMPFYVVFTLQAVAVLQAASASAATAGGQQHGGAGGEAEAAEAAAAPAPAAAGGKGRGGAKGGRGGGRRGGRAGGRGAARTPSPAPGRPTRAAAAGGQTGKGTTPHASSPSPAALAAQLWRDGCELLRRSVLPACGTWAELAACEAWGSPDYTSLLDTVLDMQSQTVVQSSSPGSGGTKAGRGAAGGGKAGEAMEVDGEEEEEEEDAGGQEQEHGSGGKAAGSRAGGSLLLEPLDEDLQRCVSVWGEAVHCLVKLGAGLAWIAQLPSGLGVLSKPVSTLQQPLVVHDSWFLKWCRN